MASGRARPRSARRLLLVALRGPLAGLALALCASSVLAPAASGQSTEAPSITSTGPFEVAEGATAVTTLTATDTDTATADLVWSTTGGADQDKFALTSGGVLTFTAAKDYENPDDADTDGSYEVTVQVSDGTNTDSADLVVTLTDVPEPPSITTAGPLSVAEGETAVGTLTATDDETAAADLTWSTTGGADQDKFTLTTAGVLTLNAAADFENPADADTDGSYEISVQVSDGTSTDSADLVVTLTNVTELASTVTGSSSVSFEENSYARVATYSASSEEDRDGVTWTITGADAAHFEIENPKGALRFDIDPVSPRIFAAPPDYESPSDTDTDNAYSITLQASAGADTTATFDVTVTVTDVDEGGSLSLSDTKPSQSTTLTLTLTDPDGVTAGTSVYKWERSTGRNSWAVIGGATSASYTPVPADTNAFLRATATYEDGFGSAKTARALTTEVVTGPLLTGLTAETATSRTDTDRRLTPGFSPGVLHYRIGCADTDTLTLSATGAGGRISIDGVQVGSGSSTDVSVTGTTNVAVTVADGAGSETEYFVHCFAARLPALATRREAGASGVIEDLILFTPAGLAIMDSNGVYRFSERVRNPGLYFRFQALNDGVYRYSHGTTDHFQVVRNKHLEVLRTVATVSPLTVTNGHDQRVLDGEKSLLLSWEPKYRSLSHLPFPDENGNPWGSQLIKDSAFQVVTPGGVAEFTWNSWGKVPLEDCSQHRFPDGYAHINAAQFVDGLFVVSLRGCSSVLAINPDLAESHKIAWRLGQSNLGAEEWASRDLGPAPLSIINDPEGEFCGQHAAQLLENGHLVMFDNGGQCVVNPWTKEVLGRQGGFARGVEYALDLDNGEAVFLRDHSFGGLRDRRASANGHLEILDNGDWLISWGGAGRGSTTYTTSEIFTQVDPATGEEKFGVIGTTQYGAERATVMPPSALAPEPEALTATLPPSTSTFVFHTGVTDSPTVVVAFNRPVVDFDETSPSLSVTGATVASVSAHVVAGEPANAYLVTLTPEGAGAITFTILANQACGSGGICAADGTLLTDVPAALVIGPPVTVAFGQAAYTASEGNTLSVTVNLSTAHQGVRGVTIPIRAGSASTASNADYALEASVTFAAGETSKRVSVELLDDDLAEGSETLLLEFATLPHGVTGGTQATSSVSVADGDTAAITFTAGQSQVAEGGGTDLTFEITNGVTFERGEAIALVVGGSATPGVDFILLDSADRGLADPYTITFPGGGSSVSFSILVLDDSDLEVTAETVTVSATLDLTGASLGTRTVTIPPSDVPDTPTVTIRGEGAVTEGEAAAFTLTRTTANSIPLSEPLTVSLQVTARGSTLAGSRPATATFEAEDTTASVEVPTLDDRVVEPTGRVTVLVLGSTSSPPLYLVGVANAAAVAVADNDTAAFTVEASADEVPEGGSVTITIAPDEVSFAEAQQISLTPAGTATPGDDFTIAGPDGELADPYTLTLRVGSASIVVTVETLADSEDDVGETVEVTVLHDGVAVGGSTIEITAPIPPPPINFIGAFGGGPTGPTPSDEDFEWNVERDIEELDESNDTPGGIWSDGTTLWILDNAEGAGDAVYAYGIESGERQQEREFELHETNRAPRGVWSDGEGTYWVSDSGQDRLFAYDLESGERIEEREIVLASRNRDARGIWSDGATVWVLDGGKDSVFAYDLESGEFIAEYALADANGDPRGLWSDGVTLWVSDHGAKRLFACRLPLLPEQPSTEVVALERVSAEEFVEPGRVGNNSPRGIWSDGVVMYVADENDDRVYSYNIPDAIDARLDALEISGVDFGEFSPLRHDYASETIPHGNIATLAATPAQPGAAVQIEPPDHDGDPANGRHLRLIPGLEISVTVTSPDGSRQRVYRLVLGEEEETGPSPDCLRGAIAVGFSLVVFEGGSLDDLVACAESRHVTALYALSGGEYVPYILGAPDFVNARFGELYAEGVPALTPLTVKSDGPATADPAIATAVTPDWSCLRGELAEGLSLVVYAGGSVDELAACAQNLDLTAIYALGEGEYVPYILGAPAFVNDAFGELFAGGVPAATPLVAKGDGLPADETGGEGEGG